MPVHAPDQAVAHASNVKAQKGTAQYRAALSIRFLKFGFGAKKVGSID